jgi:hypothetical protein
VCVFEVEFNIINPENLAKIIDISYELYSGVIILTSGQWHPDIKESLAHNLPLSETAKNKLKNCIYHSPVTDSKFIQFEY